MTEPKHDSSTMSLEDFDWEMKKCRSDILLEDITREVEAQNSILATFLNKCVAKRAEEV